MPKRLIKKTKSESKTIPNYETVRKVHFKKITQGIDALTKAERLIWERWDYRQNEEVVKHIKPQAMTAAENEKRKANGLPPRVLRRDVDKGGRVH